MVKAPHGLCIILITMLLVEEGVQQEVFHLGLASAYSIWSLIPGVVNNSKFHSSMVSRDDKNDINWVAVVKAIANQFDS